MKNVWQYRHIDLEQETPRYNLTLFADKISYICDSKFLILAVYLLYL